MDFVNKIKKNKKTAFLHHDNFLVTRQIKKGLAHNTDGIIHKLVTVFAFAPAPKTDL